MEERLIQFETAVLLTYTDFYQKDCMNGYKITAENSGAFSYDYSVDYANKEAIAALTQSLLQKYLREKHQIYIQITTDDGIEFGMCLNVIGNPDESGYWRYFFKSYEDAPEQALIQALNLIKPNENKEI